MPARVVSRAYFGAHQLVQLQLASGQHVHSRRAGFTRWHAGDEVTVWIEGPVKVLAAEAALTHGTVGCVRWHARTG